MAVGNQSRARVLYRLPEQRRFGVGGIPSALAALLLALGLFGGGLVVGRATMTRSGPTSPPAATTPAAGQSATAPTVAATPPATAAATTAEAGGAAVGRVGPKRVTNGVGVGWARSQAGAVAAAASYTKVLSSTLILDDAKRRLAIRTLAAPQAAARLQMTFDQAVASLREGLGVTAAADKGSRVLLRAVPVGWRVEQYGGGGGGPGKATEAKVAIWVTSVGGSVGGANGPVPVREGWGTTTVTLRWTAGDWKQLDTITTDGPAPIADVAPPTAAAELVTKADEFKEFNYAPGP